MNIRSSSLGELFDCAYRWEAKHVLKLRMPTSSAAHLGTSIHAGCALWDAARIAGADATIEDAQEAFEGQLNHPEYDVNWEDADIKSMSAIGKDLISKYIDATKDIQWRSVESNVTPLTIGDLDITITGTADRIYEDADGNLGIADLKTGGRVVGSDGTVDAGPHRAQLGCYELLAGVAIGEPMLAPAMIVGMQTAKTAGSRRVGIGTTEGCRELLLGQDDFPGLFMLAARILSSGVFMPNPKSVLCSEKFCPRFPQCKYHG